MPQHSYKQLEEVYQRGQQGTQTKPSENAPHVIPTREGMPRDANKPNQTSTVFARLPVGQ